MTTARGLLSCRPMNTSAPMNNPARIRFHHFRQANMTKRGRLAFTLAIIPRGDDTVAYGFAYCDARDVPSYALGRRIAEGRAQAADAGRLMRAAHGGTMAATSAKRLIEILRELESQGRLGRDWVSDAVSGVQL